MNIFIIILFIISLIITSKICKIIFRNTIGTGMAYMTRAFIDYPSLEAINSVFEEYAGDYHFSKNVN